MSNCGGLTHRAPVLLQLKQAGKGHSTRKWIAQLRHVPAASGTSLRTVVQPAGAAQRGSGHVLEHGFVANVGHSKPLPSALQVQKGPAVEETASSPGQKGRWSPGEQTQDAVGALLSQNSRRPHLLVQAQTSTPHPQGSPGSLSYVQLAGGAAQGGSAHCVHVALMVPDELSKESAQFCPGHFSLHVLTQKARGDGSSVSTQRMPAAQRTVSHGRLPAAGGGGGHTPSTAVVEFVPASAAHVLAHAPSTGRLQKTPC